MLHSVSRPGCIMWTQFATYYWNFSVGNIFIHDRVVSDPLTQITVNMWDSCSKCYDMNGYPSNREFRKPLLHYFHGFNDCSPIFLVPYCLISKLVCDFHVVSVET